MTIPSLLYRYQPFSTQSLANLKSRQIWCSKPTRFNDPFDCAISADIDDIQPGALAEEFQRLRASGIERFGSKAGKEYDSTFLSGGTINPHFATVFRDSLRKAMEAERRKMLERGVCCFSEKWDDILMWSHYADGHRGFCLAFDTKYMPFTQAKKVAYSDYFPRLSPLAISSPSDELMSPFLTKSTHWSYEQEWRVFHNQGDHAFGYGVQALAAIYFGPSMSEVHRDIICHLLHGSPTQFHQVHRSETSFSMRAERLDYVPYDYGTRIDGRSSLG